MRTQEPNASPRIISVDAVKAGFLLAGFLSLLLSVWLWFFIDKDQGLFVGLWVPAIHSLGSLVLAKTDR